MNTDEVTVIQPTELIPGMEFAVTPESVGLDQFARAADDAVAAARSRCSWADGSTDPLPEMEFIYHDALTARSTFITTCEAAYRDRNGVAVHTERDRLTEAEADFALGHGGGLLFRDAARYSAVANRHAGQLSVLTGHPVEAIVVFGCLPLRDLIADVGRVWVAPINSPLVVHPPGAAPEELQPGTVAAVDGMPLMISGAGAATVVFVETVFGKAASSSMLLRRARYHPLLRLDAPPDIWSEVDVLGIDRRMSYVDLLNEELGGLHSMANIDELERWWVQSMALNRGRSLLGLERARVRGRFPRGVGISARDDDTGVTLMYAAGIPWAVTDDKLEFFRRLVAGEDVDVEMSTGELRSARELATAGLVESLV